MKKNIKLQMIVEAGLMLALAIILNNIKIFRLPQGGSVTLAGYLPLFVYAIRWGGIPGMFIGFCYGLMDFMLDPYFVHPVQILLDYFAAYTLLGLVGFGKNRASDEGRINIGMIFWVIIGSFMRMMAGVLSGVIFFKSSLDGRFNPWIASLIYNGSYVFANTAFALIVLVAIWKSIAKVRK